MKKHVAFLIVGVILFGIGAVLNFRYEEKSIVVQAVVTEIKTSESKDSELNSDGYRHVYYGEYTVDGKTYRDVKLTTKYTNSHLPSAPYVGETYELRVNPGNPKWKMMEGGFFGVVGMVLVVWHGFALVGVGRQRKQAAAKIPEPAENTMAEE